MSQHGQSRPSWDEQELTTHIENSTEDFLETDWFIVANQLRQQNQELVKTTVYLEETIAKKQQLIQEQEEKIILLTEQSIASQNKIDQLEKELLLQEEVYKNKNQQLLVLEEQVKELETRLYRQQRSTLQYKAALNNNENSSISATIQPWTNFSEIEKDNNIQEAYQVSLNAQSLQKRNIDLPSFLIGRS